MGHAVYESESFRDEAACQNVRCAIALACLAWTHHKGGYPMRCYCIRDSLVDDSIRNRKLSHSSLFQRGLTYLKEIVS